MSEQSTQTTSRSNSTLAFIVGALVVAVAVLGYVVYDGGNSDDGITISVEGAGAAVEDAAETVSGN